jgi:hypothetical protein
MTIGCHIGWHVPLTRGKKWKKEWCHLQQSSPFSIKYSIIKILWLTNIEKSCFGPKCLNKSNNFHKRWCIIFSYVISFLAYNFIKKITYNLTFEIYLFFFIFCDMYGPNTFIAYKIFIFCWMFLKGIDWVKFQTSYISPKFTILSSNFMYTSCQIFVMQKFIFHGNNFGGLYCVYVGQHHGE